MYINKILPPLLLYKKRMKNLFCIGILTFEVASYEQCSFKVHWIKVQTEL